VALLAALGTLRRILDRIGDVLNAVAGWLLILCAVLITGDVLARDWLRVSLGATLEISSYILAVSIGWGLARAMSERQHVRIDVLVTRFPARWRQYLHAAALAAMLVWVGFLSYGVVALVLESHDFGATDRSSLAIPMVLPQGLWAAGIVLFLVFLTVLFLEVMLAILLGEAERVERLMGQRTLDEEAREALEAVGRAAEPRP
jgi:TRAP-type C4-dicarboxylate transport system permease small subunit